LPSGSQEWQYTPVIEIKIHLKRCLLNVKPHDWVIVLILNKKIAKFCVSEIDQSRGLTPRSSTRFINY